MNPLPGALNTDLADALRALNRRERFLLVGWALDRLTFQLGWEFREQLNRVLAQGRFPVETPADAFIAMDYPMLWVEAALDWSLGDMRLHEPKGLGTGAVTEASFKQHAQDADLLIAFPSGQAYDVVFIEAKGVMRWDYEQMASKLARIDAMAAIYPATAFRPHFVTVGPTKPDQASLESHSHEIRAILPRWAVGPDGQVRWLRLPQPLARRVRPTRGKLDSPDWHLEQEGWPTSGQ
jgi:hypothetical protein